MHTPNTTLEEAQQRARTAERDLAALRARDRQPMSPLREWATGEAAPSPVALPITVLPILSQVADDALAAAQKAVGGAELQRDYHIRRLGQVEAQLNEARAVLAEVTVLVAQMDEARAAHRAATQEQGS